MAFSYLFDIGAEVNCFSTLRSMAWYVLPSGGLKGSYLTDGQQESVQLQLTIAFFLLNSFIYFS